MNNLTNFINESQSSYTLNIEEIGLLDWILTDIAEETVTKSGDKKDIKLFNNLKENISKIWLKHVG